MKLEPAILILFLPKVNTMHNTLAAMTVFTSLGFCDIIGFKSGGIDGETDE
ncbi:MAG: hypothetical protein Q8R08_01955 [bacterium]|nr:hypothetical protein [bacterium]